MTLQELIKKDIDSLRKDELVIIFNQVRQLRKKKIVQLKPQSLRDIQKMTSGSISNWSEDVIHDRQDSR